MAGFHVFDLAVPVLVLILSRALSYMAGFRVFDRAAHVLVPILSRAFLAIVPP